MGALSRHARLRRMGATLSSASENGLDDEPPHTESIDGSLDFSRAA